MKKEKEKEGMLKATLPGCLYIPRVAMADQYNTHTGTRYFIDISTVLRYKFSISYTILGPLFHVVPSVFLLFTIEKCWKGM